MKRLLWLVSAGLFLSTSLLQAGCPANAQDILNGVNAIANNLQTVSNGANAKAEKLQTTLEGLQTKCKQQGKKTVCPASAVKAFGTAWNAWVKANAQASVQVDAFNKLGGSGVASPGTVKTAKVNVLGRKVKLNYLSSCKVPKNINNLIASKCPSNSTVVFCCINAKVNKAFGDLNNALGGFANQIIAACQADAQAQQDAQLQALMAQGAPEDVEPPSQDLMSTLMSVVFTLGGVIGLGSAGVGIAKAVQSRVAAGAAAKAASKYGLSTQQHEVAKAWATQAGMKDSSAARASQLGITLGKGNNAADVNRVKADLAKQKKLGRGLAAQLGAKKLPATAENIASLMPKNFKVTPQMTSYVAHRVTKLPTAVPAIKPADTLQARKLSALRAFSASRGVQPKPKPLLKFNKP